MYKIRYTNSKGNEVLTQFKNKRQLDVLMGTDAKGCIISVRITSGMSVEMHNLIAAHNQLVEMTETDELSFSETWKKEAKTRRETANTYADNNSPITFEIMQKLRWEANLIDQMLHDYESEQEKHEVELVDRFNIGALQALGMANEEHGLSDVAVEQIEEELLQK